QALAHARLVTVDGSGVHQPVPRRQRLFHAARRLVVRDLPDAQAQLRNRIAVVELHYGNLRHETSDVNGLGADSPARTGFPWHDSAAAAQLPMRGPQAGSAWRRMAPQATTNCPAHSAMASCMRCLGPATAIAKVSWCNTSDVATAHTSSTFSPRVWKYPCRRPRWMSAHRACGSVSVAAVTPARAWVASQAFKSASFMQPSRALPIELECNGLISPGRAE